MTRPRLWCAVFGAALVLAGCAKREPPSGGPPDIDPPRVISSSPDSGSAGVPAGASLSLTFSEGMEPRTTGDAISIAPRIEIRERRWSKRTLTLGLAEPLSPNRTYTLFLGPSARDRHGNPMGVGRSLVFSTSDSFPRGRIAGQVEGRGFAVAGTYLWCYEASRTGVPDSTARDFDALGLANGDGHFRVDGLAVPGRYRLWAFADLNNNRSFEPATDVLAPIDTLFTLVAEQPVADSIRISVVNPHAPGRVRGAVIDSLADSLGVLRVIAVSDADSAVNVVADAEAGGEYQIEVGAGTWWIRAFRDIDRGRTWQPDRERASPRRRVIVLPAGDLVDIRLELGPRPRVPEEP